MNVYDIMSHLFTCFDLIFLKRFKVLLLHVFYIFVHFGIFVHLCVCFFLKATIRACHEPGVSCSEFMSLFSHYTVPVFLNK